MSVEKFQHEIDNLSYFLIIVGLSGFVNAVSVTAYILWQNKFTLFLLIICTMILVGLLGVFFMARAGLKVKVEKEKQKMEDSK